MSIVSQVLQEKENESETEKRNSTVRGGKNNCIPLHGGSSGFPEVNKFTTIKGKVYYDQKTHHQAQDGRKQWLNIKGTTTFITNNLDKEKVQPRSENPGVRRRNVAFRSARNRDSGIKVSLPKYAKFMPTSLGVKSLQLPPIVIQTRATSNVPYVENCGDVPEVYVKRYKRQNEKRMSPIEEIKQPVSYEIRVMPSMELRKTLPPPSPNSIVFSLRNNEDYTQQDILDLVRRQTGIRALSAEYDPVQFRAENRDIAQTNRWIVKFGTHADARFVTYNGFKINGENVIVRLLHSVMKMEITGCKLNIAERMR